MARRKTLACLLDDEEDIVALGHHTSFLDERFYREYTSPSRENLRPVNIKYMDATSLLRSNEGFKFLETLSQSKNMEYF